MLATLAKFAQRVRGFLGFAMLIILVLSALFMWAFSRGAFDQILENFSTLSREQFFIFALTVLGMIFFVVVLLIILTYIYPSRLPSNIVENPKVHITVHHEGDTTSFVKRAFIVLALGHEAQEKEADAKGQATFYFPPGFEGKRVDINAHKDGYLKRKPMTITLKNGSSIFLSLRLEKNPQPENDAPSQTLVPELSYFLYISDSKINMLEQQIAITKREVEPVMTRLQSLSSVVAGLDKKGLIGNSGTGKPYISGEGFVKWGAIDWGLHGKLRIVFFASSNTDPMILMAGSAHHLIGEKAQVRVVTDGSLGFSGSALPGIMRSVKFAFENKGKEWADTVGDIDDYLFTMLFIQGKYLDNTRIKEFEGNFYTQRIRYVSKRLTAFSRPSSQEVRRYLQARNMSDGDKRLLEDRLRNGPKEIIVCTPLYVALAE